jgi:hypothetical protein
MLFTPICLLLEPSNWPFLAHQKMSADGGTIFELSAALLALVILQLGLD